MDKKLRVTEIALRTGLSPSTVSRVLAGKSNTSTKARQKVLDCAHELGVMDGLAAGRMLLNNLLVFAPQRAFDERTDIYYYRVIQSINNALKPHDVHLRYCALEENDSDANLFLQRMHDASTQAVILLGIDDPHIHDLAADLGKPCVMINCHDSGMRLSSVAPDHRLIGQFAARYLFDMGHQSVINVMCLRRYTMELRLLGIKQAWRARNLRFVDSMDLIDVANFSARETEEKVGAWLDQRNDRALPTAFLVGGDFMAAGTMVALQKRGLRVPQDTSVMSIDGFNLSAIQDVPLTAVHVPRDELGDEAVHLLQRQLLRPDAQHGSLLLHGTLAVRDSVRRIRSGNRRTSVEPKGLYDD
ncbi:LacI family DNA-binding transcriptional regulator [Klebsiella indica]|uniref:LacI family transcriptional regulator n=1 Tax=Klebsiella indica TaxID=2582917 RepID=A0A5R9LJ67_9ENTR|nr:MULTISPECIES: LacI family DNA-binding transcriptional regulator [Klebsiella]TLV19165.1 LacI family transcriptional regulator [Klebsiella indica]